ncbi:MAG: hypothetical protein VYD57_18705 [Pseudomonadota bacterium]|nr:hypothetical protein [Pseudomonadota bacterium]
MIHDAYYDTVRRALAEKLTRIAFGSSDQTADRADLDFAVTDAVIVPVSAVSFDPNDVRLMKLHYELPRGEAVGLTIYEIAVLDLDGRVVARKVRSTPITIEPTDTIGDTYELKV